MSVIQFQISKAVAAAIALPEARARAQVAGITTPRVEYNDGKGSHGTLHGQLRITCSRPMAAFLCDEIVALAERSSGELVIECAYAGKNILDALKPPAPTIPGLSREVLQSTREVSMTTEQLQLFNDFMTAYNNAGVKGSGTVGGSSGFPLTSINLNYQPAAGDPVSAITISPVMENGALALRIAPVRQRS